MRSGAARSSPFRRPASLPARPDRDPRAASVRPEPGPPVRGPLGALLAAALLAGLPALTACGREGGPRPVPCPADSAGVPVVSSGKQGEWARHGLTPRLEEVWQAGGLREGEELAAPLPPAAGLQGRLAIPDFRLGKVFVLGADGAWSGAWGGRGEGPGEYLRPIAAAWSREGRLAVLDVAAGRVVFLRDGRAARDPVRVAPDLLGRLVAGGELRWQAIGPDGTLFLLPPVRADTGAGGAPSARSFLLRAVPGGAGADTLLSARERTLGGDFPGWHAPGWPRLVAAAGPHGEVVAAGWEPGYRLAEFGPDGSLVRFVCRGVPAIPFRDAERGTAASDSAPARVRALRRALESAPAPSRPAAVGRIFIGAEGRIWAQRDRPRALAPGDATFGPPGGTFDVFGPEGRWLGEVRAAEGARLVAASGRRVWAFVRGDLDQTTVVAYRLVLERG